MSAQATMLTGQAPSQHGIVANGWLYKDAQEVRFWQQSHQLLDCPNTMPMEDCAQIFWWFAQGGPAKYKVFPKPHYGCEGSKVFDIFDQSDCQLTDKLGPFPFHAFWGPFAGLASSKWIVAAAMEVMKQKNPRLAMVYLPHLDYDYQRHAPDADQPLEELDQLLQILKVFCQERDRELVIVSEYGLEEVNTPVFINRVLRQEGWLKTRHGPFGHQLLPWESEAFGVCDHQIAHIYTPKGVSPKVVRERLESVSGVESLHHPEELQLNHHRSGDWVAIAKKGHWFDYRYWLPEERAPDFASTIDIHRKPGYDPCELQCGPKWNIGRRMLQKKLGLRTKFDIIDTNPHSIRGSHGRPAAPENGPVFIGHHPPKNMEELSGWVKDRLENS
jgi:predicted AlkP superfamily pyrophosphatase or phosphodiesterase